MAKFYLETPKKSEEGLEKSEFYHEKIDEDVSFKRMTPDKKSVTVSFQPEGKVIIHKSRGVQFLWNRN